MKKIFGFLILAACGKQAESGHDITYTPGIVESKTCPSYPDSRIEVVACNLPANASLFGIGTVKEYAPTAALRTDLIGDKTVRAQMAISRASFGLLSASGVSHFAERDGTIVKDLDTARWSTGDRRKLERSLAYVAEQSTTGSVLMINDGTANVVFVSPEGKKTASFATASPTARVVCQTIGCATTDSTIAREQFGISRALTAFSSFPANGVPTTKNVTQVPLEGEEVLAIDPNHGTTILVSRLADGSGVSFRRLRAADSTVLGTVYEREWSLEETLVQSTFDHTAAYVLGLDPKLNVRVVTRIPFDGAMATLPSTIGWSNIYAAGGSIYGTRSQELVRFANAATDAMLPAEVMLPAASRFGAVVPMLRKLTTVSTPSVEGVGFIRTFVTFDHEGTRVLARIMN